MDRMHLGTGRGLAGLPIWARRTADNTLRLRILNDRACCDCDTTDRTECYMVHDHLWAAAGMRQGFLCIGCLETRLGRQLVAGDFKDVPINWDTHWNIPGYQHVPRLRSLRLQNRLDRRMVLVSSAA
jgi:hypothetical protein